MKQYKKEREAGQILFSFCLGIYPEGLIKARINDQSVQSFSYPRFQPAIREHVRIFLIIEKQSSKRISLYSCEDN
jgi:hypothetical protein